MKWNVLRIFRGETYTIGKFYIDGTYFCNTLEDRDRFFRGEKKIYGETCIHTGLYNIEWIFWDKHQLWYPHLLNTSEFEGILIHAGIDTSMTEGCLLLGDNDVKGQVHNGLTYMEKLRMFRNVKDIELDII
jgi:hypothetical protein